MRTVSSCAIFNAFGVLLKKCFLVQANDCLLGMHGMQGTNPVWRMNITGTRRAQARHESFLCGRIPYLLYPRWF